MALERVNRIVGGLKGRLLGESGGDQTTPLPSSGPAETNGGAGGSFTSIARSASTGDLGDSIHATEGVDAQSYRARAAAHGREITLAGEGMNTSEDGALFWGPFDNDSARAKAAEKILTIDQDECISCGTCEENSGTVFHLTDDMAEVIAQDGPMDLIQEAIDACPVMCINWLDEDEIEEQHSHGGFEP